MKIWKESVRLLLMSLFLIVAGCDSGANDEEGQAAVDVDLDALFAPAQAAELQSILDDWAQRDISVQNLQEVASDTMSFTFGRQSVIRVVSHEVGGNTHYGAIVTPVGAADESLPVLVYNHGGDGGENVDQTITLLSLGVDEIINQFIYVVPSFRDEPLTVNGMTYQSDGPASPWDYDVDDALALLNAALESTPAADPDRIGAFGFSRGGGVALLMGIRDPRIDLVSEFFGPTDFFVQDIRDTVVEALMGAPRDLPGMDFLNENYIQPLGEGTVSIAEARIEMIRRSPVLFADLLPDVQIQHGEIDDIVVVDHALSLSETLQDMGRDATQLELHLYPNAGHSPLQMVGSFDRLVEFVNRLIEMPT